MELRYAILQCVGMFTSPETLQILYVWRFYEGLITKAWLKITSISGPPSPLYTMGSGVKNPNLLVMDVQAYPGACQE